MKHTSYVLLTFVIGAILFGLTVQAAVVSGMAQFAIPDERMLNLLNQSTIAAIFAAVVSFFVAIRNQKVMRFIDEVISELRQVTWPTRDETVRASTTVVLTTFFTAALLAFYDVIWKNLADLVLMAQG